MGVPCSDWVGSEVRGNFPIGARSAHRRVQWSDGRRDDAHLPRSAVEDDEVDGLERGERRGGHLQRARTPKASVSPRAASIALNA